MEMQVQGRPLFRVLVVDDEELARQRLKDLLRGDADIDTVDEASDGAIAVSMIAAVAPNIVLLDVQMPELCGFDVIEAVGAEDMPVTIFVTAFDQYAIRAFDANALDYLLKPYSDERFLQALARAKKRVVESRQYDFRRQLRSILPFEGQQPFERLLVKSGAVIKVVKVCDIERIEAAGVYANIYADGAEHLYRMSLNELAARLDTETFVRIHRSTMVNVNAILQLKSITHGEYEVLLQSGARVRVSRSYRAELEQKLGQPL